MAFSKEIKIKLTIDGKAAQASLSLTDENIQALTRSVKSSEAAGRNAGEALVKGFDNARVALQGVQEVQRVFSATFGKTLSLYAVQEQAELRLSATMKAKNIYTAESFELLKKQASLLQRITVIGDEQSLKLQALALNMGVAYEQVNGVLQGSVGLAELYASAGLGQEQALKGVALALKGEFTILQRYIPELRAAGTASEKMAVLQEKMAQGFSVARETANSASGSIVQLSNSFGDFNEQIGGAVAMAITPLVKGLAELFSALNSGIPGFSGFAGAVTLAGGALFTLKVTGILPVIKNLMTMRVSLFATAASARSTTPAIMGLGGAFRAAGAAAKGFFASLGPVGWAVLGISGALELWGLFAGNAQEKQDNLKESVKGAVKETDAYAESLKKVSYQDMRARLIEINKQLGIQKKNYYSLKIAAETFMAFDGKQGEAAMKRAKIIEAMQARENEAEQYRVKQKAVQAKLEIALLDEGKQKELKLLDVFYKEQQNKAKGNDAALRLLDAVFLKKREEINRKYKDREIEDQVQLTRHKLKLTQIKLNAEGASDSVLLQSKEHFLEELLALYTDNKEKTAEILRQMDVVAAQRNAALIKEEAEKAEAGQNIEQARFDNALKLARAQGASEIEIAQMVLDHAIAAQEKIKGAEYKTADARILAETRANGEVLAAEKTLADARISERRRVNQAAIQFGKETWAALSDVAQQYADQQKQRDTEAINREFARRQEALKTERDKRLQSAFTEAQRARINKEMDDKQKALEEEAAERKKQAAKEAFEVQKSISYVNTVINIAEAVMQAYAQTGIFGGPVAAGIVAAIGAAQLALIASQEPPGFAQGGLFIGSGGPEEDANLVRLSNGEYVVNNAMTQKYFSLVDDINNNRVYYGGDGIVQELRALREENRAMRKGLDRVSRRPVKARVGLAKHETGAIIQQGEYFTERHRL